MAWPPCPKAGLNRFVRAVAGMQLPDWAGPGPDPLADLQSLYGRAQICRTFPAYKLEDLDGDAPVLELLEALELLDVAQKALA